VAYIRGRVGGKRIPKQRKPGGPDNPIDSLVEDDPVDSAVKDDLVVADFADAVDAWPLLFSLVCHTLRR